DLAADPQCSAGQVDAHRLVVAEGSLEGEPFALIVEDHADECPDVCLECAALRVEHGGPRWRLFLPQPCEHVVQHADSHLTQPPTVRRRRRRRAPPPPTPARPPCPTRPPPPPRPPPRARGAAPRPAGSARPRGAPRVAAAAPGGARGGAAAPPQAGARQSSTLSS